MKLTLFGSSPSAIQATFTPAPVMPSDRAVFWFGLSESVLVSDRPSGSSCTEPFLPHAPGMLLVGRLVGAADGLAAFLVAAGAAGAVILMVEFGMTAATELSDRSHDISPLETVAEN